MKLTIIIFVLIGLLVFLRYKEFLNTQVLTILTIVRGILAPYPLFWSLSDTLLGNDANGIHLYNQMKRKTDKPVYPIKIFKQPVYLVLDSDYRKEILDNSPFVFGVGEYKNWFFKSFMAKNVGVSTGCPWIYRRKLNEKALATDCLHPYVQHYHNFISDLVAKTKPPSKLEDFAPTALAITMKVVFNDTGKPVPEVVNIFKEANTVSGLFGGIDLTSKGNFQVYEKYLKKNIKDPRPYSLIEMVGCAPPDELFHQIPHWVFPTNGIFYQHLPRILLLISKHPEVLNKILEEIKALSDINDAEQVYNLQYLRAAILEAFRMTNAVTSMFRTLLKDGYKFKSQLTKGDTNHYKKDNQFLILNNPVLRSPECYTKPNQYKPERWMGPVHHNECAAYKTAQEDSYCALMFSQGPQRCPGKELIIFLLQSYLVNYFKTYGFFDVKNGKGWKKTFPYLDKKNIPQAVNPFSIRFFY